LDDVDFIAIFFNKAANSKLEFSTRLWTPAPTQGVGILHNVEQKNKDIIITAVLNTVRFRSVRTRGETVRLTNGAS
jgi:hypothetical protein